ncbi:polysaccharide deacetylase family protein [Paenochrobactrum sp. BZR 588]|uniref:polysaccharide deacetylase family protein n=1 Tax=unclassified Paenochrobactrum TaxID=2639760 RepID=UPI003854E8A0
MFKPVFAGLLFLTHLGAATVLSAPAQADNLAEPQLFIQPGGSKGAQVALTLDACSGKTDLRILNMLVAEKIPATFFITARWLQHNEPAMKVMLAHPDLFQIENHGAQHVPAITTIPTMYGIKTAGSLEAVEKEVQGGTDAIKAAGAPQPQWYRDATARYSNDAISHIEEMGYKIGGYSLNADMGASLSSGATEKRILNARDGDVIIAHINQPSRKAGEGVATGILKLKQRGMRFVRLKDVQSSHSVLTAKPTQH